MNTERMIREDFNRSKNVMKMSEEYADKRLVDWASFAMAEKLENHRKEEGRHGWHDINVCTTDDLRQMLDDAYRDDDMVSIMIFSAMIYVREISEKHQ